VKVLVLPDYRESNPYQRDLYESLAKHGVLIRFGESFSLFSVLRSIITRSTPDALHLHWTHPFILGSNRVRTIIQASTFIAKLLLLKITGVKIVWTVHNIVNHESCYPSLERYVTLSFLKLCDAVIVHGEAAKEALFREYALSHTFQRLVHVIPHGNYIGSYRNEIKRTEARTRLGLAQNDLVLLHFGLIRDYKGIPELIKDFYRLSEERVRLVIAGKPLNHAIQQSVDELAKRDNRINVHWGFIQNDDVQVYMNVADVVVLPYRNILTSGGVILAMSFGKAVIAPALGCIPDVLDNEGSFLYDPSQENGLLEAMQLALKADLKKMGEHNFELAKKLSWDDIARTTFQVYQDVTTGRKRHS
jgi:glycosyltransferase involved in cell wall biosynthesis